MAEFKEVMKQKKRMCEYCEENCNSCDGSIFVSNSDPDRFEKFVMDWAKEHPVVTNKDKFREIFGTYTLESLRKCPFAASKKCLGESSCAKCDLNNFWEKEYKEPEGENI